MSVRFMSVRLTCAALVLAFAALPVVTSAPASAARLAQAYPHHEKRLGRLCKPPLKFAAGACVRRCPAGYTSTGRYCRYRNMSR